MRIAFEVHQGTTGVLLIHGLSGTPYEVQPLGTFLASHGYAILGPWLAGHGTSPRDLFHTPWQDWYLSAIEAYVYLMNRYHTVYVIGLSMGADLALLLSAQFPTQGVVALSGVIQIPDWRFQGIGFFKYVQWWTTRLKGGILNTQAPQHQTYSWVPTQAIHEQKKLMNRLKSQLNNIKIPALIVQGKKDSIIPPLNGEWIYQGIASATKELVSLEHSDHVVTMDNDQAFLFEKIHQFIQNSSRTRV